MDMSVTRDSETGFLQVGGSRLEYRQLAPMVEKAPTLVLLHEGLGSVSLWRDFPDQLAARTGCGVLVYSRLGYGNSDPVALPRPLSYMHDEALEVLPLVLDAAGVNHALLLGHSDGGSIALINAGGLSDPRVCGLVLMAPHVFVEQVSVDSISDSLRQFVDGGLRSRLLRFHGDNVDCAFYGWNRAWLDPQFRHWNIEEFLPRIQVPVLVIQGLGDEYGSDRQLQAIEAQIPGAVELLRLENCGHAPHRDQSGPTLDAIDEFIDRLCRRCRG